MLRTAAVVTALAFAAPPCSAQTPQTPPPLAPRAFAFPDTLGANFDIADSAKAVGAPTDYDFLEGTWRFQFQQRHPDGTFSPAFAGEWSAHKKPGGLLVEDHWRGDSPGQPSESGTYTYRAFNQATKRWEMMGVNTQNPRWGPGLTWSDGENRYAIQHQGPTIMRIRYFAIKPNEFSWRADMSADGGKTWSRDWWTMHVTRVGG